MPATPLPDGTHAVLLSFDIDGTLEDGDPPGPVAMSLASRAMSLGYVVGSASDRTLRDQANVWARRGIEPDFVSHKHTLEEIALRFPAARRVHVGDTEVDRYYARLAGFEFIMAPSVTEEVAWAVWVERLATEEGWETGP